MEAIISESFEKMVKAYENVLKSFYPARGSTGFTESNQVHIYINSLISALNDAEAIAWLEFPWEDKKQHIDGFVYSPKHKAVFYIEAKRLSIAKKKSEIVRDINRIYHADRSFVKEHNVVAFEHEYIIALSDVWLESKWKKSMPEWWCGCDNLSSQVLKWEQASDSKLTKPSSLLSDELQAIGWSDSSNYAYWLGEKLANVKNYCLLIASKKI